MKGQSGYVPPPYIPLEQSDSVPEVFPPKEDISVPRQPGDGPVQWSSGICACFDDMQSCCIGLPGCFVACYACAYRRALRTKYNLQEAPCGDFVTHFFCHLCAICQEYREIRERSGDANAPDLRLAVVTAPPIQTMETSSEQ